MDYVLTLTFICDSGEKSNLSIDNVNSAITKDQVSALMDTIIAKNIFLTKNGSFTGKAGAKLTEKTVTEFTVA